MADTVINIRFGGELSPISDNAPDPSPPDLPDDMVCVPFRLHGMDCELYVSEADGIQVDYHGAAPGFDFDRDLTADEKLQLKVVRNLAIKKLRDKLGRPVAVFIGDVGE